MNKWDRLRDQLHPDSPFPQEVSPETARELLADMDAMYAALLECAETLLSAALVTNNSKVVSDIQTAYAVARAALKRMER